MSYQLDFAPHLGFPTPPFSLHDALPMSTDPGRQSEFAAEHGFRRIQDPFAAQRSVADQEGIGDAAAAAGLGQGCFVYAPLARAFQPWWSATDESARRELDADIDAAIAIAHRLRSRHIAVFTGTNPDRPKADQRRAMAANLRSEEHTSELQSLMRISYAVFCLTK